MEIYIDEKKLNEEVQKLNELKMLTDIKKNENYLYVTYKTEEFKISFTKNLQLVKNFESYVENSKLLDKEEVQEYVNKFVKNFVWKDSILIRDFFIK